MDVTIKNKKSDKEKVIQNAGVETGPKASEYKFNTMNLPIMGSNFQVSIGAGKEKTFEGVSSVQALYMQSAASIINEGNNGGSEEYIPKHYDWTIQMGQSGFYIVEDTSGIVLHPTDTVTLDASSLEVPQPINVTIEKTTDEIVIEPMNANQWITFASGSSFGYTVFEHHSVGEGVFTSRQNMCVGLYNGSVKVELIVFYYYSKEGFDKNCIRIGFYGGCFDVGTIKSVTSLTTATLALGYRYDSDIESLFEILNNKYDIEFQEDATIEEVLLCADRDIVIDYDLNESTTHTICEGEYYYYFENKFYGTYVDTASQYIEEEIKYYVDLYICKVDGNVQGGIIVKPVENNQQ